MYGVALEEGIKLSQLNSVFLELFVLCAEVAGWGFALSPCLSAFKDNLFAHNVVMPEEAGQVKATGRWRPSRQIDSHLSWLGLEEPAASPPRRVPSS